MLFPKPTRNREVEPNMELPPPQRILKLAKFHFLLMQTTLHSLAHLSGIRSCRLDLDRKIKQMKKLENDRWMMALTITIHTHDSQGGTGHQYLRKPAKVRRLLSTTIVLPGINTRNGRSLGTPVLARGLGRGRDLIIETVGIEKNHTGTIETGKENGVGRHLDIITRRKNQATVIDTKEISYYLSNYCLYHFNFLSCQVQKTVVFPLPTKLSSNSPIKFEII